MTEDLTPRQALAMALRRAYPSRRRGDDELAAATIIAALPPGWRLTHTPTAASPEGSGREPRSRTAGRDKG